MIGRPYFPLTLAADANNDGKVDGEDEALFDEALGLPQGYADYDIHFDYDLSGVINSLDELRFRSQLEFNNNLDDIRLMTDKGEFTKLTWPDGWECWMSACNWQGLRKFVGLAVSGYGIGYIHARAALDPVYGGQGVGCSKYARVSEIAAYKAFGYGRLMYASSQVGHVYNIFWTGDDWHDLRNWWILEPQSGTAFSAGEGIGGTYQTKSIKFDDYWVEEGGQEGLVLYGHYLNVDYSDRRVSYSGTWRDTRQNYGYYDIEPFPPDNVFDTSLGINKEMLIGDVNGDGKIDIADAQLVFQHILGTHSLTGDAFTRADVNKDGDVDVADAQVILQKVLGLL